MSIFDHIKKTTRQRLEKLGVTLNIPDVDVPDDEDTKSRAIIDIYNEIMERSNKQATPATYPVPASLSEELKIIAAPLCANNQTLLTTIESWIEDRKSILPDIDEKTALTKEKATSELYAILSHLNVLLKITDTPQDWVKAAQSIAQTQERNIRNLLLQASNQFESDNFDDWINQMNERITRFGIKLVKIDDKMGITSCETSQ